MKNPSMAIVLDFVGRIDPRYDIEGLLGAIFGDSSDLYVLAWLKIVAESIDVKNFFSGEV